MVSKYLLVSKKCIQCTKQELETVSINKYQETTLQRNCIGVISVIMK
jgi:hypothetical protein